MCEERRAFNLNVGARRFAGSPCQQESVVCLLNGLLIERSASSNLCSPHRLQWIRSDGGSLICPDCGGHQCGGREHGSVLNRDLMREGGTWSVLRWRYRRCSVPIVSIALLSIQWNKRAALCLLKRDMMMIMIVRQAEKL